MTEPEEPLPPEFDRTELGLRDRDLDPIGARLRLYLYYAPIVGWVPAAIAMGQGGLDDPARIAARRAVTLGLGWAIGLALLSMVGDRADNPALSLLLLQSGWNSAYCLICVGLMVSVWRRRSWAIGPGRGRSPRSNPESGRWG